jgi:hypothetical protein
MPHVDDTDGDGIDDTVFVCAGYDFDGDGLSDADEISLGTDFLMTDTDGDKVSDGVEVKEGKNPLDPTDNPTPQASPTSNNAQQLVGTEQAEGEATPPQDPATEDCDDQAADAPCDDGITIELATEEPAGDQVRVAAR